MANSAGELQPLELQAGGEVGLEPAVDRLLRRPQRERRAADELRGQLARGGVDLVGRHHLVDQADPQRLLGADEAAGEDEVLGPGRADQPRQPLGAAGAGDDAEQDLGLAELGVVAATRKSAHSASSQPPPSA